MFKVLNTLALVFFSSISSFAQNQEDARKVAYEALPSCDQAVAFDSEYLVTSLPSISGKNLVRVTAVAGVNPDFDILAQGRVVDLKIDSGMIYILTQNSLEIWDQNNQKRIFISKSHPTPQKSWRAFASGFIIHGDFAVISHGVAGVAVLNLKSGKFEKTISMPTVSSAQDIALLDQSTAILAIDNDDEAEFRGLYFMDLKSLAFTKQVFIDNAFPSAIRVLDGDRLMLVFFNAIWKFDLKEVLNSKRPQPERRAWKMPGVPLTDMAGKVAFDQKYVYACFKIYDSKAEKIVQKPMAIDLNTLKLN